MSGRDLWSLRVLWYRSHSVAAKDEWLSDARLWRVLAMRHDMGAE